MYIQLISRTCMYLKCFPCFSKWFKFFFSIRSHFNKFHFWSSSNTNHGRTLFFHSCKPLGISYVYVLQFVLLKKQKQSLLVTQFCKLVHIKIKNFNSISFEQLFELIILLNWAMSYTHLSKKKNLMKKIVVL